MHGWRRGQRALRLRFHGGCRSARWAVPVGARGSAAAASEGGDMLQAPEPDATPERVEEFVQRVHRSLFEAGEEMQFQARGPRAVQRSLKALSEGPRAAVFSVSWAGTAVESGGNGRFLHFAARAGLKWEDYWRSRLQHTAGLFVERNSPVLALAQNVVREEKRQGGVRIHAEIDDEVAVNVLAKALATAPLVYTKQGPRTFRCTPNIAKAGDSDRLFVYVEGAEPDGDRQLPPPTGATFQAMVPGSGAERDAVRRFFAAVHDRLFRGDEVAMECHSVPALEHAMRALCLLKERTAEVEAEWAERRAGSGGNRGKVLALRARRGVTWEAFNAADAKRFRLLFATKATDVKKLAYAIAKEVRSNGGVAVHTYSDNPAAINTVASALATVPLVTGGERVCCVPSFGHAGEKRHPTLRLSVRRADRRTPEAS